VTVRAPTQAEQDRAGYALWIEGQLHEIETYGGSGFDIWDRKKLERAGIDRNDSDVFRGPWRLCRPYVTQEMLWWVEAYGMPRLTFSEWQARARADRDRESHRVREWLESADYCLSELEVLREMLSRRDELIATARDRGASSAQVETASGLSRMQVHTIRTRYRSDVAPAPRVKPSPTRVDFADAPELRVVDGELVEVI
jgi:hypothetical protein